MFLEVFTPNVSHFSVIQKSREQKICYTIYAWLTWNSTNGGDAPKGGHTDSDCKLFIFRQENNLCGCIDGVCTVYICKLYDIGR